MDASGQSRTSYSYSNLFNLEIIQRFAIVDLSNFYLDAAKDRLYVGGTSSFTRRSCQTVLAAHLLSIVKLVAPILPHLESMKTQLLPSLTSMIINQLREANPGMNLVVPDFVSPLIAKDANSAPHISEQIGQSGETVNQVHGELNGYEE